jgi:hypothetical protein
MYYRATGLVPMTDTYCSAEMLGGVPGILHGCDDLHADNLHTVLQPALDISYL